jgi:DNA polymerase-3 subunit delta'
MWHGIEGHDEIAAEFETAIARGRLASTFLFLGPAGIGKRTFAIKLAQMLLCQAQNGCGTCDSCVQVAAGSHPDLLRVSKPADKATIPLELLIGDDEHRMREGLLYELGLKPFMGGRKIAIIDDADFFKVEGANALLKTLEEPPPRSVLILVGTSAERQLPTIRSRAQVIRFRPLPVEVVEKLLLSTGRVDDPAEARRLALHAEGSLARAGELADPELWRFRTRLLQHAAAPHKKSTAFAQELAEFVDQAGKEAGPRRDRLRLLVGFAVDLYREMLRRQCGSAAADDPELAQAATHALAGWPADQELTATSLERCLETLNQIDRNANQSNLIECWLDDLAAARMA